MFINHHEPLIGAELPERKALAMAEYSSVASGMVALDAITKTADVEILSAKIICPGKYIVLFYGSIGAVNASLDAALNIATVIDYFMLGSPHPDIYHALKSQTTIFEKNALGLIETFSGASAISAADRAAKTAFVHLINITLSNGMCGKSVVLITGEVAAVSAALEAASNEAAAKSMLLDTALIPNPSDEMIKALMM